METFVTLRQFDHEHELLYAGVDAQEAPFLTRETFSPRGNTALNDAIALGIADADKAEKTMPEDVKHLLVIVTDGFENASVEHDAASIKRLIKAREKRGWTVVFLQGEISQDQAVHHASFYGVASGNVASYSGSRGATGPLGATGSTGAVGAVTNMLRTSEGSVTLADTGVSQDYGNIEEEE